MAKRPIAPDVSQEIYEGLARINPELTNALFYLVCVQRVQQTALEKGKFMDSNELMAAVANEMDMTTEQLRAKQMTWVQKNILSQARTYLLSALDDDLFSSAFYIASQLPKLEMQLLSLADAEKNVRAKLELYRELSKIVGARTAAILGMDAPLEDTSDGLDFVRKHREQIARQVIGKIVDVNADDKPPEE